MSKLKIIFILFFIATNTVFAEDLSTTEQKIVRYIEEQQKSQLSLLEKLVNINSGTNNIKGVKAVGALLKPEFEKLGFKTRWVYEPESMQRAPTLVAERVGTKGKRLLLIGHLDTVFPKNSSFQKFSIKDDTAIGPGVIDIKGGDVVILYALKALDKVHALDNTSITVVLTGDEEDSGKPTSISRKPLFEAAKKSDIALDFECDISQDTVTVGRRGISMWTLETKGNQEHSALIFKPGVGDGAIFELSRILNTIRQQFEHDKNISINAGLILGGTQLQYSKSNVEGSAFGKENVIAKTALARGDFRFTSKDEKEKIIKKLHAITKQSLPQTQAKLLIQDGIPAMTQTSANMDLLGQYSSVSQDLGYGTIKPLPANLRGAGDISHIADMVSANLAGLGPLGSGAHSLQESLDIPSLSMQTKRAAVLMYRLTHKQ